MKKRTIKQWTAVVLLVLLAVALISVVHVRAVYEVNDDGVCWYWMNKSHEGAEIARALGGDNQQVLAYFGRQWTDWNNLQKHVGQRKRKKPTWSTLATGLLLLMPMTDSQHQEWRTLPVRLVLATVCRLAVLSTLTAWGVTP